MWSQEISPSIIIIYYYQSLSYGSMVKSIVMDYIIYISILCVCVCVCVKYSWINHGLHHNVLFLWLNPTFDQDTQVPMLKTTTEALPVTVVALLQCTNCTRHERKQIKNKCWNLRFAEVKAGKKNKMCVTKSCEEQSTFSKFNPTFHS